VAPYNTGIWRSAANIVIVVILVLAISELMLRVPAMMGQDLAAPEIDLTRRHILALGDSLTNPHGVPEEETYTAHLQRLLDETTPDTFRMVNLGVVGVSSSYVANRLPDNLARYRPDFAIVWAGLNIRPDLIENHETRNFWSTARSIAASSEIVRFIQVWRQNREMEMRDGEPSKWPDLIFPQSTNVHLDRKNESQQDFLQTLSEEQMREMIEWDYRRIVETTRSFGTKVIFVTYPVNLGPAARANAVMREVALELNVPLISSGTAAKRVPEKERVWLWASHPTGPIYREIAVDIAKMIQPQLETETSDASPQSDPANLPPKSR
jgi:hypothetical protein